MPRDAGMQPARGTGAATDAGMQLARGAGSFLGLVVYYAAITTSQYWQGKPGVSKGFKSPGSF